MILNKIDLPLEKYLINRFINMSKKLILKEKMESLSI